MGHKVRKDRSERAPPPKPKRFDPFKDPMSYPYPSPDLVQSPIPLCWLSPPFFPQKVTRQLFLRGVAATYAVAFISPWPQIDGLYANHGILPAHPFLRKNVNSLKYADGSVMAFQRDELTFTNCRNFPDIYEKPFEFVIKMLGINYLELFPHIFGLNVAYTMELFCAIGGLLGILCTLNTW